MEMRQLVLREGSDWVGLREIDRRDGLFLVLEGTVGAPGDVIQLGRGIPSRLADVVGPDGNTLVSPFDTEIVVDILTKEVLLDEAGGSDPLHQGDRLVGSLLQAGLRKQARIVRDRLRGEGGASAGESMAA